MINKRFLPVCICAFLFTFGFSCIAQEHDQIDVIELSKPDLNSGKLLMQALKDRKSSRLFSSQELSETALSNLLWAAFGVNRKNGKHTAPSAVNAQNITIYVATKNGVFKYIPEKYRMVSVIKKDIRKEAGYQKFLQTAPVILIYVADFSNLSKMDEHDKIFYCAANTGYISQNVYLFCSSDNLATVAVGWAKREALAKVLKLKKDHRVMLIQPVGYSG